ncbi:MAG: phosphate acyltransferase PlsX [Chlamydiales bacterium]|nr:phosphate acyltransferase PlsX [Chlamydiales bacterium]
MRGQSNSPVRVAVDLQGSDTTPDLLLPSLLALHEELKDSVSFTFFVPQELAPKIPKTISAVVCQEVIVMEDDPLSAIRKKKNSSLVQGVTRMQKGEIDAFISAGNTGALLGASHMLLPLLPGIDRAGLLTLLPTRQKEIAIIDVGANVACKPEHLFQFALMGVAYLKSCGIESPTIGLLNIGSEPIKGTAELRETYQRLQEFCKKESSVHFAGNIEARDVFKGEIDLLVTDGFSGNIFLKTAEGLAAFILELLEETSAYAGLRHRLNYAEYPGAILCGVEGVIVKCHGTASPQSFIRSIRGAVRLVQHSFLDKIRAELTL